MTSESFGCHDISRHRLGASARWESCCFGLPEGAGPVTVVAAGIVWMHCTRVGCYWTRVGCTLGRWGFRAVRTTLGQWSPTLVEQADSGRDSKWGRCRTLTTGPQLRWRAGNGGGRPVTETPGCAARTPDSLLRGPVSTALTSTSPAPVRPVGIVGILRFFLGAQRRCGVDVSTMDTSDLLGPASACQTSSLRALSPPGPPACPRLPPERVPQTS